MRVLVKHARDAFVDDVTIAREWQPLSFPAAPTLRNAIDEYEAFLDILRKTGAQIDFLPRDARVNLDSIYARDASVVCERGVILGRMGKRLRRSEPDAQQAAF